MYYVAVKWMHDVPDELAHLYYELDADRHERRKIEVHRDGTAHCADATHGQGSTFLSWEPHPPLTEINADPEFRAQEITRDDFERVWNRVLRHELEAAVYA